MQLKLHAFFIFLLDGVFVQLQSPSKQTTVTMDGPPESYNMVMTGGPILAIRPTYR